MVKVSRRFRRKLILCRGGHLFLKQFRELISRHYYERSGSLGKALDYIIWEVGTLFPFEALRNPPQCHRVAFQQTTVLNNAAVSQNSQSCSSHAGVNFSVLLRQFILNCIRFTQEMKRLSAWGMCPFLVDNSPCPLWSAIDRSFLNLRPLSVCFTDRNGWDAPGAKSRLYAGWSRLLVTQLHAKKTPYYYRCIQAYSLPRRNWHIPSPWQVILPH
jgi:hypothetical protein